MNERAELALLQRREVLTVAGNALRRCRADGDDLETTAAAVTAAVLDAFEQHIVLTLEQIEALALIAHRESADELEVGPHADEAVFVMPCPRGRFATIGRDGDARDLGGDAWTPLGTPAGLGTPAPSAERRR